MKPSLRIGIGVLAAVLLIHPVLALEGDQYYAWGRELDDATDLLNVKVELEINRALAKINERGSRGLRCSQVVRRVIPSFRQLIFGEFELWLTNSSLIDRAPADGAEELEFRRSYLYSNTGPLDMGTKVPPSPTLEVNGVLVGTDKFTHFFSEGYMYFKWYTRYRETGLSASEAELRAIQRGIIWERTILGSATSGVFSLGDLEANHAGMRFMTELCEDGSPSLEEGEDGWSYSGGFDFRKYVTPEWDESYQPPIYGKRRWKKVRPVLVEYCGMLNDPGVRARRLDYKLRDRVTPTEAELARMIEVGKLSDPGQFTLEHNCALEDAGAATRASIPTWNWGQDSD